MIGLNVIKKSITSIGCKLNRDSTKRLLKHLYLYRSDPKKVREELIRGAIEIFLCFESQFTQVTANGVWQNAIHKLAADAVSRVINHLKNDTEEELSAASITMGIIYGESKTYTFFKSTGFPRWTPGHTFQFKNSDESCNTADLFVQSGLVTIKNDGTADKYYKNKISSNHDYKYGYRRLLKSEPEDTIIEKYSETESPEEKYTYVLIATEIENLVQKIMEKTSKDKGRKEISENLLAQIKQEADNYFKDIETFVTNNNEMLMNALKNNQVEIIDNFERGFLQLVDEMKKLNVKKEEVKKSIWFDVKEPVTTFVPRQVLMSEITERLKSGVVVISGFSGMGKSELVRKYAQEQCGYYNGNVIWIDATTQQTMRESFYRLFKGPLKIKNKSKEEDEDPLDLMIKEIYECFGHTKSLFILDSAVSYDSIKPFLPSKLSPNISKPDIMITSQNSIDWESDIISFKSLSLHGFTDDEAIQLVRHVLDVKDDSQTKVLTVFVNNLCNFPLALNQASLYIKDKQKFSKYTIADFMSEFNKVPKKLKEDEYLKTVFSTLRVTLSRITNEKTQEILDVISYFESNQIPKYLLETLGGHISEILKDLVKYSIVRLEGDMVSVHGLVQKTCRKMLKEDKKEFSVLTKALDLLKNKVKQYDKMISLRAHVISVWNHANVYDKLIATYLIKDIVGTKAHISYFHLLAGGSNFEVFNLILKKIKVNGTVNFEKIICAEDGQGGVPVHYAASNEDTQVLDLLIQEGAQINVSKGDGLWTPLHFAVKKNYHKNVMVLLTNKIEVDAKTKLEFTALHFAAKNGHSEIVEMLINSGGADVNARCKRSFTPLHFAAKLNHIEVVHTLVDHPKIDVNAQTEMGKTPLHFSAKAGDPESVEAILEKGADPNAKDTGHFTPLHLAACFGHKEVVDALLRSKEIDVNAQTSKQNTPMHLAAEKGHLEIVKALTAKKAKVDIRNEDGKLAFELTPKR